MHTELSLFDWHARFEQQARWTQDIRRYLYGRASVAGSRRVLDVGCGTGVLEKELQQLSHAKIFGVDIARNHLDMATRNTQGAFYIQGDAHSLPFHSSTFDLALCHYLLLWVAEPFKVVQEMMRVAVPGGVVLALAEPDYGGRIDYPPELTPLGEQQRLSLRKQGADPEIGRKLAGIFRKAGLTSIEFGVLGGQWRSTTSKAEWDSEWRVLENDLRQSLEEATDVSELKALNWSAWQRGERVLFVPTFYAIGFVPRL